MLNHIELFLDPGLALDESLHLIVVHGFAKCFVNRVKFIEQGKKNLTQALFDLLIHRLVWIENRLLFQ